VSRAVQGYMDDTGDYTASMFNASIPASQTTIGYAAEVTQQVREVRFATCEHRRMTFVFPIGPILESGVDYVEQVGITSDVTTVEIKYSTKQGERLRDQQPMYGSKEPGDHRGHIRARALGGPPEPVNLFWQDGHINSGRMRVFETGIRETLTEHKTWTAKLRIELIYLPRASCNNHLWRPTGLIYNVWYFNSKGVNTGSNQLRVQN
jgi:hypothetical protein